MSKQDPESINPSIDSAKLRRLEEIKKEQARIAAEEAAEMDRLSKIPLQKPKIKEDSKGDNQPSYENSYGNKQELDNLAKIKQQQAQNVQAEADEMSRLAKQQHDEIEQRHQDDNVDPDDDEARIDNYNMQKIAAIKQQQARIAEQEAEEMNKLAQQHRQSGTAENRLAAIQQAERERFTSSGGYKEEIFTQEQVDKTFKLFNGAFIGMLISLNLFMFVMDELTPLLAFVFITTGICILLAMNRNITTYIWGAVALSVYSYHSYDLHGFISADFIAHVICTIAQPIGFIIWSNVIAEQNKQEHAGYNPEHDDPDAKIHVKVAVRRMRPRQFIYITIAFSLIFSLFYMGLEMANVLSIFSADKNNIPMIEIFLSSMMVIGQLLMILRYREQWLVWILCNSIAFWLWVGSPVWIMAGQYALISLCSVMALYLWSLESKLFEQSERNKAKI